MMLSETEREAEIPFFSLVPSSNLHLFRPISSSQPEGTSMGASLRNAAATGLNSPEIERAGESQRMAETIIVQGLVPMACCLFHG